VQLHEVLYPFSQGQPRTAIIHSKKAPFTGHKAAFVFAFALAFLVVIPVGDLLLYLPFRSWDWSEASTAEEMFLTPINAFNIL
jgi:hypothetical protein